MTEPIRPRTQEGKDLLAYVTGDIKMADLAEPDWEDRWAKVIADIEVAADSNIHKPDGWYILHFCGGYPRQVKWTGPDAQCSFCGKWVRMSLHHEEYPGRTPR